MMNLAFFLRDLIALLKQLIPSPINFFNSYYFSPSDLPRTAINVDGDDDYATATTTIDVLTYNINNVAIKCCNRRRRIRHAICSSGADIVLLQETNPAWEEYLLQENGSLATQYRYCYFHHPGITDRAAGGIAILSRYPLHVNKVHILNFTTDVNGSVFPALICSIHNIPLGKYHHVTLNIANVHLRPPVELDGTAKLDTARITEPVRLQEVRELIRRSNACYFNTSYSRTNNQMDSRHYNLDIIAGDFNEGDEANALTYLTKTLGYSNALQRHVPKRKETHTWPFMIIRNNNWLVFVLRKRLDHILWHNRPILTVMSNDNVGGSDVVMEEYSAKLQCIGCGVLTGYEDGASDHQPVLSRFVIIGQIS
jgi:endonuclease/exonuclease/phosphatase family metal-dependent hydrolase